MEFSANYISSWVMENGVLVGFGVVLFICFAVSYLAIIRQYGKAISIIIAINKPLIVKKSDLPVDIEKNFLEAVGKTEIGYLRESLTNHMLGIIGSNNRTISSESKLFFNLQAIKDEAISEETISLAKSICISCGVLGTFIGLVVGIHGAAEGLASTDANLARASLEELLSGAGIAFVTSLGGLGCAILIALLVANRERKLEGVWCAFSRNLLSVFPYSHSERALINIRNRLDDSNKLAQQLCNSFDSLSKQLSIGARSDLSDVSKHLQSSNATLVAIHQALSKTQKMVLVENKKT